METITNPDLWSHTGHGQAQGLMALTVLIVMGTAVVVSSVVSAVMSRLRPSRSQ
jgi:hypothetical protein